jgi:DNA-binding NarL/FixJ family response regulator
VAAGKSDAQAAAILGISVRTVHKHLEHIYEKLGVEGRTAAVMRACAAAGQSSVASGPNTDAPGGTTRGGMVR